MENLSLSNSVNYSKWDCPVCYQLPKGNIFQCANGHAICNLCSARINECPTCRSPGVKIRNRLAENLLDDMEFPCFWKGQGCTEIMKRCNISAHEDQCMFSPDTINLCSMFSRSKTCKYQVNPNTLCKLANRNELLDHMTTCHNFVYRAGKQYGKQWSIKLKTLQTKMFKPKFFDIVESGSVNTTGPLFFYMPLVDHNDTDSKLTWVLVHLTPKSVPVRCKLTIKGNQSSAVSSTWGSESVATLGWTVKSMNAAEYIDLIGKLENKEKTAPLTFPFWLNISLLRSYYVDKNGSLQIECSIEK